MSYSYPKNKEEYWQNVNDYWENLRDILGMFLSKEQVLLADEMRQQQNPDIVRILNEAWWLAPDSRGLHSIPSWHVLCDLCSEEHVLYNGEEEIE